MRVWDECKEKRLEIEVIEGTEKIRVPHSDVHKGEAIDLCCYEAVGGMAEALSRHADEAYQELTEPLQKLAEQVLRCLTERGPDNREMRRPLTVRDICAVTEADEKEVIAVVETFRRPGRSFLMPPAGIPLTSDSLIDISHESLIRNWKRLQEWVEDEARCARTYRRLAETAVFYRAGEAALWREPDLQMALDWRDHVEPNEAWARRYHPEFDAAIDFLEKSKKQQHEETAEREREQRERIEQAEALAEARRRQLEVEVKSASRLRRLAAAVVTLISLLAVMGFLYAGTERALRLEKENNLRRNKAGSVSSQVLAQLYKVLIGTDPEQARRNALEIQSKLDQARASYHLDGSPVGEGITLNNIAGFHRLLAQSYSAIEDYTNARANYQQSQDYYFQALEILERELGSEHTDVATTLTGLATIDVDQGKYAEAEPLLERSLMILSNALDPSDRYLADAIMNLAECYNAQGKYDQAGPLYERALEIRRNKLSENHPDLAESLYALGWFYFERGKYAEAEPLFNQALAIWRQSDKRNAATVLDALSLLYRAKGNPAEAERYLELAWNIYSDFTERDRLSIAYHLENVGLLHGDEDKPDAETAYNTAIGIWTKALGKDHPTRAFGLSNHAFFYYKNARYPDAERLFNEALAIQQALPLSPALARTSYGLARLYTDQGKYSDAEPLFKQALAIQEKAIPEHPDLADTLDAYAGLLSKTDHQTAASEARSRAGRIRQAHREQNSGDR
jgi:tetratricopeptide (TPR) repeat protein